MPEVTLENLRPIPRHPPAVGLWVTAQAEGAPTKDGPWTFRDSAALAAYPDPIDPPFFDFTFTMDPADVWIRVVWLDAAAGTSTTDEQKVDGSATLPPSVADLRNRSEAITRLYPLDPYDPIAEDRLAAALQVAVDIVESLTGRNLEDGSLPADLTSLAVQAVIFQAEQIALSTGWKTTRSRLSPGMLKSISAGPWSETYFGADEAAAMKRLSPDSLLHTLLWALATDEMREYWLGIWGEGFAPAAAGMEIGWGLRNYRGY